MCKRALWIIFTDTGFPRLAIRKGYVPEKSQTANNKIGI
jgi:hypothetical protein